MRIPAMLTNIRRRVLVASIPGMAIGALLCAHRDPPIYETLHSTQDRGLLWVLYRVLRRPSTVRTEDPGGSVQAAAKIWGVSKSTAARWISDSSVPVKQAIRPRPLFEQRAYEAGVWDMNLMLSGLGITAWEIGCSIRNCRVDGNRKVRAVEQWPSRRQPRKTQTVQGRTIRGNTGGSSLSSSLL